MRLIDAFKAIIAPEPDEPSRFYAGTGSVRTDAPPPKLRALPRNAPSEDEFDAWKDDPVTQFVLGALSLAADAQAQEWTKASWSTGQANPLLLHELRTRADAYRAMADSDYTGFCEMCGLEPRLAEPPE